MRKLFLLLAVPSLALAQVKPSPGEPASGTNTGDVTLGTPNGLSLLGQQLSLGAASGTAAGALTAGSQTIGGTKTFLSEVQSNGVYSTSLTNPVAPVLTLGTGTLASGTYFYQITATNSVGETDYFSPEASITITGPAGVNLSWPAVPGATGYKVYGRAETYEEFMVAVSTTSWLDNGSITPTPLAYAPSQNSTGAVSGRRLVASAPSGDYALVLEDGALFCFDGVTCSTYGYWDSGYLELTLPSLYVDGHITATGDIQGSAFVATVSGTNPAVTIPADAMICLDGATCANSISSTTYPPAALPTLDSHLLGTSVWSLRASISSAGSAYHSIASNGASGWVLGGEFGYVAYSANDGATWMAYFADIPTTESEWYVTYGDGKWVGVGGSAFASGATTVSTNGTTWNQGTISPSGAQMRAVIWTGTAFVAVGSSVAGSSTDGLTWTDRSATLPAGEYYGLAWNGTVLVAIGTNVVATADASGTTWTARSITAGNWTGVAWNGTRFAAVSTSDLVGTSPTGTTWTTAAVPTATKDYTGVVWTGALFVSTGTAGACMVSADGLLWSERTMPSASYVGIASSGTSVMTVGALTATQSVHFTAASP